MAELISMNNLKQNTEFFLVHLIIKIWLLHFNPLPDILVSGSASSAENNDVKNMDKRGTII